VFQAEKEGREETRRKGLRKIVLTPLSFNIRMVLRAEGEANCLEKFLFLWFTA
jgi:hypothetical protein